MTGELCRKLLVMGKQNAAGLPEQRRLESPILAFKDANQ
jgi:hypothetical protein